MKGSKGSTTTFFGNNICLVTEWVFLPPTCSVSFESASQLDFLFTAFCCLLVTLLSQLESGTSLNFNFVLKFLT